MNLKFPLVLAVLLLLLAACGTTDSSLKEQGRSDAYVLGFHDGRHSGMKEEGNNFEHYIRDEQRFNENADYRSGWLAGEAEGIKLQDQANMAGNIAAGTYSSYQVGKEVDKQTDYDKIARDAVKDVDTSSLNSLDKD
jgi:hypothetical protein